MVLVPETSESAVINILTADRCDPDRVNDDGIRLSGAAMFTCALIFSVKGVE